MVSTSPTEQWCSDAPRTTSSSVATLLSLQQRPAATPHNLKLGACGVPPQHNILTPTCIQLDRVPSPPHLALVTCPHASPYLHTMAICLSLICSSHLLMHSTNSRGSQTAQRSRQGKICQSLYRLQWQSGTSSDWHRSACPLDHSSVFIHARTVPFPQHSFFSRPTPICIRPVIE
jgi:hypothetical protein